MTKIDWTKWASISEIVSSAAILLTLIYLALQTHQQTIQTEQNTAAILSSGRQAALQAELDWIYKGMDHPEVFASEVPDFDDGLDRDAKVRNVVQIAALLRIRENDWLQYQNGAIDAETWDAYMASLLRAFKVNRYLSWEWEMMSDQLDPDFVRYIDEAKQ